MNNFLDNLYDALFHPNQAMAGIAENKLTGQSLTVIVLSVLIPLWALYLGLRTAGMYHIFGLAALVQILGSLAMWVVGAAVWHLIAEFFGGRGSAVGLLAALGFAQLPRIFIVPFWVLAALLPAGTGAVTMAVSALAIGIWTLYLDIAALRGAHGLSGAKAVLVFLTPVLAVAAAVIAGVIFAGAALIRMPWEML